MRTCSAPWAIAAICLSCIAAAGNSPPTSGGNSERLVQSALQSEVEGDAAQRSSLLAAAVKADPQNESARWQSGQLHLKGTWADYSALPDALAQDAAVRNYRDIRGSYPQTRRGQLELADWCRDHKLPERERAHLTAALALSADPDDPILRARLGFQLVDGAWTTPGELAAAKEGQSAQQRDVMNWQPRIAQLSRKLDARRQEIRDAALDELKSLQDPTLIPALESALTGAGLPRERLLVELLDNIPSHKAADALARAAVFSTWDAVRKEASAALHDRPIESYAPELIRSLRTPVDSRISLYVGAGGVHLLRSHVSETQYVRQEIVGQSSVFIRPVILGSFESGAAAERAQNRVNRVIANAAIEAELKGRAAERNAKLQSEMIGRWNERICGVLKSATGVNLPNDARQWWTWWYDYNQMEEEEKQTERRRYYEQRTEVVAVADPTQISSPEAVPQPAPQPVNPGQPRECLVAGTPVWTDRGFAPIEEVQIGDLVLAQDAATGELCYQPVLWTTVRDEEPTLEVVTAKGAIRATGGHTFWVTGRGWTKLKQAKPGERFHAIDGPVEIVSIEPADKAKTYNLVVADSHTYFAGTALALTHDVTFAEPVDAVLPGLRPQWNARR